MEIKGVVLLGKPVFTVDKYAVIIGYIETVERKSDIPHYLIVNTEHKVVEGSSASLFEARGMCSYTAKQISQQEELIAKGEALFEKEEKGTSGNKWN